jgi:hypothetical protein
MERDRMMSRRFRRTSFLILALAATALRSFAGEYSPNAFSLQDRTAPKPPRRTQLVLQAEGFYFNGESGLMSTDEVIAGFPKTFYKAVWPLGAGALIRRVLSPAGGAAFILGARYIPMSLELEELGEVFGTLDLKPWVVYAGLEFAIASSPNGNGNFVTLEAGGGPVSAAFTNGPALEALGEPYGINYAVAVKNGTFLEAIVGVRTIVSPIVISLGLGYFHVPGGVKTTWSASGSGGSLVIEDLDHLVVTGVMISAGLGLKFGL